MRKLKKTVKKQVKPVVKEVKKEVKLDTLEAACDFYNVEYREGVTRMIDLAKNLGVDYQDGYSLQQIIDQSPKKR